MDIRRNKGDVQNRSISKQGAIVPNLVNLGSQVAQKNPSVDNGVAARKRVRFLLRQVDSLVRTIVIN